MFLSIGAVGAAVAARALLAVDRPLWHDEIFTTWAARMSPRELLGALRHDSGPPLFYLLEKPFAAVAEKAGFDGAVRVLPWLAALAVFAAARSLPRGGARGWFLTLAALSPFLLLYSAEARAYALLALLDLAAFLLLFRGPPTPARLIAGGLASAAALWTHYLALFFLCVAGALLLATRRWRAAAALVAALLLFLPWLPALLAQPRSATAWIHESAGRSAAMFLSALGGSARVPLPVGAPLPYPLLPAAAAVGMWLSLSVAMRARADREVADAALLTGGTLLLLLGVSLARPVAVAGRSEMAVLPIWLWAVARGAPRSRAVRISAGAAALAALWTCAVTIASPRPEAAPNAIARLVSREAAPGDRVIASTAFYLPIRLAKDRGRMAADLRAFPPDQALHPGWFVPEPAPPSAYDALRAELDGLPAGARAFLVVHPLWAGPELERALAASGSRRDLLRQPDALVILWRPSRPRQSAAAASALGSARP